MLITTVLSHSNSNSNSNSDPVPLPMMAELLTDGLFVTECAPSQRSYTSVADLHGVLFAITHIGNVDLIQYQKGAFKIIQSVSGEHIFCFDKFNS